jgi:hypothetical protein
MMPFENDLLATLAEPLGYVTSNIKINLNACCILLPIGKEYAQSVNDGTFLYLNLFMGDMKKYFQMLEVEKANIAKHYTGKIVQKIYKDGKYLIRKSSIKLENRIDFGIIACFNIGSIWVHGLVEKCDFNWTITSIKKALNGAKLLNATLLINDEQETLLRINHI